MTYAVHIGVKPRHLNNINRIFLDLAKVDGDGWNTWGEAPGTDVNDADTLHVVIGPFGGQMLAEAISHYLIDFDDAAEVLVPIADYPRLRGEAPARVVLTDWDDWSALGGVEREVLQFDVSHR